MMLKVGIIGAGRIGKVHGESISKYVKGAEVKAIADPFLNEETKRYEPAMVSIIPQNYPHVTISDIAEGPSYWEYLFFAP